MKFLYITGYDKVNQVVFKNYCEFVNHVSDMNFWNYIFFEK